MFVAATVESSETAESLWNHVKEKPGVLHFLFLTFPVFSLSLSLHQGIVKWWCESVCVESLWEKQKKNEKHVGY